MRGLPSPGRLSTRLQSTRGHQARTCVTEGAAKAEATGPSPLGQLAGGAAAPEEANEASRGQEQRGGQRHLLEPGTCGMREERESSQSQPWPALPVPNTRRGTRMVLVGGVGAGGNKSIYLPQLHPVGQGPSCWGTAPRFTRRGPADPGAGETVGGLPSWLGIREGPEWEITELAQNWASKA